ncbi:hypothetical protein DVH05_000144 [Phytophthora capsici]|nr:hypothetical protein DVH05_000144 [Phytophthora capsici]
MGCKPLRFSQSVVRATLKNRSNFVRSSQNAANETVSGFSGSKAAALFKPLHQRLIIGVVFVIIWDLQEKRTKSPLLRCREAGSRTQLDSKSAL